MTSPVGGKDLVLREDVVAYVRASLLNWEAANTDAATDNLTRGIQRCGWERQHFHDVIDGVVDGREIDGWNYSSRTVLHTVRSLSRLTPRQVERVRREPWFSPEALACLDDNATASWLATVDRLRRHWRPPGTPGASSAHWFRQAFRDLLTTPFALWVAMRADVPSRMSVVRLTEWTVAFAEVDFASTSGFDLGAVMRPWARIVAGASWWRAGYSPAEARAALREAGSQEDRERVLARVRTLAAVAPPPDPQK